MKHLNIILLEDSPEDADLIERELRKAGIRFTCRRVDTQGEFERALEEFTPDVVLADHSLPTFNSIEAFQVFRTFHKDNAGLIPFILVTGEVSEEFAVQCLKAGVHDYILKDRLKRLPLAVQSALEKCRTEAERRHYLREVIEKEAVMTEAGHMAHLGSWQLDMITGKYTWSDENYCIYGYEKGQVEPGFDAFFEVVHPDDVATVKARLQDAIHQTGETEGVFRIIDRQGNLRFIHSKLQVHRDGNGKPTRIIGFNLDITERKKAEISLKTSRQEYKSLFDQHPDGVFSLDPTGTFTNANRTVLALTGRTLEELRLMRFRSFVQPDDIERINGHFLEALQRKPQRFEVTALTASGQALVMDITYMPIVVNDNVIGVHGIAKDITASRHLESMLDKAYRFARIGGWECSLHDRRITWTPITRQIHEVDDGSTPTLEAALDFYKEGESRETIRRAVDRCIANGEPFDLELQIITARGNERWVRATGELERINGRDVRLYGTFQNIHDRKTAEETLHEAWQEKVSILESIGDAFFAIDRNWTVTYWNSMAENLLSVRRDDILGKNLWDIFADAVGLDSHKQYRRAMDERIPIHFEDYYPRLDAWFEVNAYPSPSGLSIYFKDISDKKKYIRKIELQNEQLREVARIQSHEVRAPLARVLGLVNIIQEGSLCPEERDRLLSEIVQSAGELDEVIRKIVRATEDLA